MKSRFSLTACFLTIVSFVYSQQKNSYLVEYFYEQSSPASLNDSISAKTGSSTAIIGSFKVRFYMIATSDSSKMFFSIADPDGQSKGIKMVMNTPDTIFYKKGQWWKINEGEIADVNTLNITVNETADKKNIAGYECVRFVSTDSNYVFWLAKELPSSLIPFTGVRELQSGILEMQNLKERMIATALSVRELK